MNGCIPLQRVKNNNKKKNWQCYLVSFHSIWVKGIIDKVMGIGLPFLFVRWINTQLQNTKYMAVFESFPDSVLLRILLSDLLHIISFSQSCYTSYPSLSLVTHHILLSVLLHIVSISSLGFIFLCCMKEWPVKQTKNHGFFQMRRISSASCAWHLRVITCLVIFITGSTSSSATSSVGRRLGRLTMVNTSSVLRHLISWSRGISLVLHQFID